MSLSSVFSLTSRRLFCMKEIQRKDFIRFFWFNSLPFHVRCNSNDSKLFSTRKVLSSLNPKKKYRENLIIFIVKDTFPFSFSFFLFFYSSEENNEDGSSAKKEEKNFLYLTLKFIAQFSIFNNVFHHRLSSCNTKKKKNNENKRARLVLRHSFCTLSGCFRKNTHTHIY